MPLVSIVVPVFNEEGNVQRAHEALKGVADSLAGKYRFEIIFTDNHSTDGTFAELQQIAAGDPEVRVLRFARNFGVNKSILTGYRYARGAAAIQIDCDLQDPPSLIPEFLKHWEQGYDVVVGARQRRQEGFLMQQCRRMYYRLFRWLTDDPVVVDAGEFRLVDRHILDELRCIDDAYPFPRGLVASLARRQMAIPYDRLQREHGRSKFPLLKLTRYAINGLLSHTTLPLRAATLAGMFIATAALCLSIYFFIGRILWGADWPTGFATLSVIILFSASLNAFCLGIIGEYVGRIYVQLRRRPIVVIERTINCDVPRLGRPAAAEDGSRGRSP
jgi:dolichol-phosphate mannosyltransferase